MGKYNLNLPQGLSYHLGRPLPGMSIWSSPFKCGRFKQWLFCKCVCNSSLQELVSILDIDYASPCIFLLRFCRSEELWSGISQTAICIIFWSVVLCICTCISCKLIIPALVFLKQYVLGLPPKPWLWLLLIFFLIIIFFFFKRSTGGWGSFLFDLLVTWPVLCFCLCFFAGTPQLWTQGSKEQYINTMIVIGLCMCEITKWGLKNQVLI